MSSAAPEFILGDRLSPLPEDRKNIIRVDRPVDANQERSWQEENRKFVKQVLKNVGEYFPFPCNSVFVKLLFFLACFQQSTYPTTLLAITSVARTFKRLDRMTQAGEAANSLRCSEMKLPSSVAQMVWSLCL